MLAPIPAITTTATPMVVGVGAAALNDTAHLSGSYSPIGTITFTLTGPGNTVVDTETVPVSGNGDYTTPTGYVPVQAGTYYWVAQFNSSTDNLQDVASGVLDEPVTVNKGSTSIVTAISDSGTGTVGDSVYDTATITFTPATSFAKGGTVTYTFSGSELAGLTVASGWTASTSTSWTDTVTVGSSGSVPNSDLTGALPAGTDYGFSATYTGDANYTGSTSPTGSEPLTINKGSTSIVTAISDSGTGTVGDSVYDTATITFTPATSFAKGGTVTYTFSGSELAGLTVASGWTASTSTSWTDTVTVGSSGSVPNSDLTGALPAGTDYGFSATYTGDANYTGSTSPTGSEPLTINKGSTSIVTAISDSGTGTVGDSVYDTATITFTPATSFAKGGTVTYTFSGSELAGLTVASGWTASTSTSWTDTVTVGSSGSVPNSDLTGALPAGTDYGFSATYTGDANYTGSTSPTGSEPLTINKGSTSIVTAISDSGTGTVGDSVYDTATITFTPATSFAKGGTVTYTFSGSELAGLTVASGWTASTSTSWTDTVTVGSSGSVPNSDLTGALPAGTDYGFSATYTGDANYTGSTSPTGSEPLTINKGSTSIVTAISDSGTGTVGDSVYDTATITFTPATSFAKGGTVTYTFSGSELAGLTVASGWTASTSTSWTDTVTVGSSGSVPNSDLTGALPAGTDYGFSATYTGDANYTGSTSPTGSEPLTINKGSTSIVTAISDSGTGTVGDSVYDTATITFTPATSFAKGGTVTYTFSGSELAGLTVASGWTASTSTSWTDTVTVGSSGSVPNSDLTGALPAGTDYGFSATYTGDANYTGSTSPTGSEPLTINKGSTSIVTAISDSGTGTVGDSVYDTATITFTPATSFAKGGTVTYTFSGSELAGLTVASGWTASTSTSWTDTVTVGSSGSVPNSDLTGALPAGTDYGFSATYTGNANYTGSTSPTGSEPLTIKPASPVLYTAASGSIALNASGAPTITDKAFLSGGYLPDGLTSTITFTLSLNGGTPFLVATDTVTGNGEYDASYTLPTTGVVTGTYLWHAVYSGDADNKGTDDTKSTRSAETTMVSPASPTITTTPGVTATSFGTNDFATIGFWHNKNGQAVINGFNGSSTATVLGNSLATNYPALFGTPNPYTSASLASFSKTTFAGLTNAQVAATYLNLWTPGGLQKNTYVQAFAVALGLYATGGSPSFSVGGNGAAFGVANGTTLTVAQVLTAVNNNFNTTTGIFYGGNSTNTSDANNVLNGINTSGESGGGSTLLNAGVELTDSATLSGGYYDTGTIIFYLLAPGATSSTPLTSAVYKDTVMVTANGTYTTSQGDNAGGYIPTTTGTYQWVVVYSGDGNNTGVTSPFGTEPDVVGAQPPNVTVTKTADSPTITAGQTAGFKVTITNTGGAATGLTLSDPLPAGPSGLVNWIIDTSGTGLGAGTNPSSFVISGLVSHQTLSLNGQPITLAAGASLSVHITGATSAADGGGSTLSALGAAGNYAVLYEGTGGHNLSISNVTVNGNIGVGGTGVVQFSGPGTITGRLDFSAANTGQYHNTNGSNVGPTSVNYSVAAVTNALNTVNSLSSSLAGLGSGLTINGTQTINESAGQLNTIGGITYRVFNVTSYSETDGKLVTINGDGSGNPVVFNFGFGANVNLGGDVALAGGLTDDQVLWNFTTTGRNVSLNNNASSFPQPAAFHGILLAPNDAISVVNASLDGRIFGGGSCDMQIVSGDTIIAPKTPGTLVNTATVSATGDTGQPGETATATITVVPPSVTITGVGATISGTKYLDLTGNGFSADDTGLGGVTINLYKDVSGDGVLGSGDGSPVATTVTGTNGSFSFSGLMPGTYFVQEVVPSGSLQTGGGPFGSAGATYYTVSVNNGPTYGGNNFDDFKIDSCAATNINFYINGCATPVTNLRGATLQGQTVQVKFTIPAGASPDQVSLVSYTAPSALFDATVAYQQQIYDLATGTFGPGTYSLTVQIPNCYYQIDFVCGAAINQLGPPSAGPDSANVFYTPQGRLFSADNGGIQACGSGQAAIGKGDFATPSFWLAAKGQTLINTFNSPNSSTAPGLTSLSQWLVSTFPNLYGVGTGTHSLVGLTNAQVATNFGTKFSGADQQVLSTALSMYATSINLAGTGATNLAKTDGFTISAGGSASHVYNVLTNGAAFGIANNTTAPVLQLLEELNLQTAPGASLSSGAGTVFTAVNNSTGHISLTANGVESSNANVALLNSIADLGTGTILVYVDNSQGNVTTDEQAAIDRAIAALNGDLSAFGVSLVDDSADPAGLISANIIISMADSSDIGGQAEGVLGVTEMGGSVTLIDTWNYYFGPDVSQVGAQQYDFQTVATHELGHALGLGHSTDTASVMFPYLNPGEARHDLTTTDLANIELATESAPEPLAAAPRAQVAAQQIAVPAPRILNVVTANALVSATQNSQTSGSAVTLAQPAGQVFQIGNLPPVSTLATGISQQQGADRLFSALGRSTAFATEMNTPSRSQDNSSSLYWDGTASKQDSSFPGQSAPVADTQTDPLGDTSYQDARDVQANLDRIAMDICFAQMTDEMDDFGDN